LKKSFSMEGKDDLDQPESHTHHKIIAKLYVPVFCR